MIEEQQPEDSTLANSAEYAASKDHGDGDEYEFTIEMMKVEQSIQGGADTDSDSNDLFQSKDQSIEPETSSLTSTIAVVKNVFSAALLIFCIIVVSAAIFEKQTKATGEYTLHPVVAFVVFWVLLLFLAQLEGGLNCMVGLKPVDKDLYDHSHPITFGCTSIAHKGENLDRFIVGRQYLDLTCVFTTSFMVSAIDDASILGLPQSISYVFLDSGVAVILVTIVVGQLVAQINSATCMLDFINNRVMLFSTYVALTVEASGILHATYLVQILMGKIAGLKSEEQEQKTTFQKTTFWLRVAFSVSFLSLAFFITFTALFNGDTTMWTGIPFYGSVLIFLFLVIVVGIMEGLQIALMAVVHMSEDELKDHPVARRNCDLMFGGQNLQAFLVGRQICQTIIMFVIARITTLDPQDENVFGVSDGIQQVLNTGILGALISTIVASLSWRVIASSFPVAFLANPLSNPIMHLCLLVEKTGVCNIAWSMAKVHKRLAGFKDDGYYLGSLKDRTAKGELGDDLVLTQRGSDSGGSDSESSVSQKADVV